MNTKVINHCLFRLQNILDDLEGKERRVRTPDGIRKFDQPLGSVIRTDKLPDIKKPPRFNKDSVKKVYTHDSTLKRKHKIYKE